MTKLYDLSRAFRCASRHVTYISPVVSVPKIKVCTLWENLHLSQSVDCFVGPGGPPRNDKII